MPKADNMLAILWLLKSRRKMTAAEFAEQLEVHIRTVYRCIDALCVAGVPIVAETGRDGGYYIPDHFKLEPLFFDAEEQKALLQAASFARESGYPSEEALNRGRRQNQALYESGAIRAHGAAGEPARSDSAARRYAAQVERTENRAHFKLDEARLYTQVPYQLLSYGGKIRIVAPEELKACMVEIAASLLHYYQS
jgi:predicted DNA-binding transcriptional regulator YafY